VPLTNNNIAGRFDSLVPPLGEEGPPHTRGTAISPSGKLNPAHALIVATW
jgi:hypothetical protein